MEPKAEQHEEVTSVNSRMAGGPPGGEDNGKAGSAPSSFLGLCHQPVEMLLLYSALPLSSNPAWLLPEPAHCLGHQSSGFS